MRAIDETWQADLVEMLPYARENNGYKYVLTVIDIFSKYAWAVPVKSKSGPDVTSAMQSILVQGRVPTNLHTDKRKEFYNSHFKELLQRCGINHYSTHSNLKASICERPKFKVGDRVRVSKHKHVFEKGYTPNWTTEVFTVDRTMLTSPVTYKLKDYQDQPIAGGLYEQELLKVKHPDIYLVEKVIKKLDSKIFAKWLGFDSSHNSWIDQSDM
ncbi:uncharacterized protein LOC117178429 [Belonocnema kinseyi]|uniref:uncharacterized protein LOC117178429 n=1 Tax=Belonocnema kinseyi TaxID=2817044 RepID=UPI00143DF119|nr:uncharacterized protein LOC117178429 [Belonocnema kinseyi]